MPPPLRWWSQMSAASRGTPAVAAALVLTAGALVHERIPVAPIVWLVLAWMFGIAAALLLRKSTASNWTTIAAITFAGITAAQIERFQFPNNHIATFAAEQQQLAQIEL